MNDGTDQSINIELLYTSDDRAVRPAFVELSEAAAYYKTLVGFVRQFVPAGARILDVGCGCGWSAFCLADSSYEVVGIDLNPKSFQCPPRDRLELREGSLLDLKFNNGHFDAVIAYQCLEHVPAPERALDEMGRVIRPEGVIVILSPNLLSLSFPMRAIFKYVWQNRPLRRILFRDPGMPRHPFGNTLAENLFYLMRNWLIVTRLLIFGGYKFRMRVPDTAPPFHSDNDACFVLNPLELTRALRRRGYQVVCHQSPALNIPFAYLFASGTYVVGRKPALAKQ